MRFSPAYVGGLGLYLLRPILFLESRLLDMATPLPRPLRFPGARPRPPESETPPRVPYLLRDVVVEVALPAPQVRNGNGLQLLFQKAQALLLH